MDNWIKNATIYQIYPLTFRNGDGACSEWKKEDNWYGDLKGIQQKLAYIQSLNVDAIWLSPIFQSPLKDGFGYNVADYKKIHPLLGSLEDFDALIKESHGRGIKVMLDMVFSHTSDQHEWFVQSKNSSSIAKNPYADFYVWSDPVYDGQGNRQPPNNWLSMDLQKASAWAWSEERRQYYLHYFNQSMPVLNMSNPEVQDALIDVAKFWLDRDVDGFRMDALSHMGHDPLFRNNPVSDPAAGYQGQIQAYTTAQPSAKDFLRKLKKLKESYPARFLPDLPEEPYSMGLLGEVMGNDAFAKDLVQEGLLDTVYTGKLTGNLLHFRQIVEDTLSQSGNIINWAMGNHDMPRVLDRTMGDKAVPQHAVLYAGMLAALPGSICIFQGDELALRQGNLSEIKRNDPVGLTSSFMGEIDAVRAALPWADRANEKIWMATPAANTLWAPEFQEGFDGSPLQQIKKIFNFRKTNKTMREDSTLSFPQTNDPEILLAVRSSQDGAEHVLCVFNFASQPKRIDFKTENDQASSEYCPALGVIFKPFKSAGDSNLNFSVCSV